MDQRNKDEGTASIFSAPLAAIQNRVVAFAPFIASMDLGWLELIVAPPFESIALNDNGLHGGIREYSFE
ncbi:hypothetical protein [uncultured Roseobacter sp.]|uniref:hypothetical protein n=1 Tax=uncultured Roseobacter sp. TaxID=114847 RepID=UPI002603CE64|nr:hypothetical protein [uncultured Roseobacter sp.]